MRAALLEGVDGCEVRASLEYDSDAINVGLLRLASERRKNEADSENDREPDHPHGHLGRDGWGSLAERHDTHQHGAARGGRSHEPS
jgi:hypothetical protein